MSLLTPVRPARPLAITVTAVVSALLLIACALAVVPAHAAPHAATSQNIEISMDVTVRKDDTFHMKMTMIDSAEIAVITEDRCNSILGSSGGDGRFPGTAKADFSTEDSKRTCVIEGSAPISESNGSIKHEDGEYVVDMSQVSGSDTGSVDIAYSVTFPGEVTESAGGTVEGNTVSFDRYEQQVVRGRDAAGLPWTWIIIGIIIVAALAAIIGALVVTSRRKRGQQGPLQPAPAGAAPGQQPTTPGQQLPPQQPQPPAGPHPQQ